MSFNDSCEKMSGDRVQRKKKKNPLSIFRLTEEGATPVNWRILFLVIFTLFGSCYSITFLFPFLPEMMLFFGYKEEDKGYYSGLVASSMFAGRAVGSYFWGWISDKIGRRPVILLCLAGVAISNVTFGFSTSIVLALVSRFVNGLCNGLVGVCKTVLYEISDNTNQAVGMSFIGFSWGGGVIMGPLISGYIANPAKRYPAVFSEEGFFGQFPYLLPSLLAGVITSVVLVFDIFIFPETLASKDKNVSAEKVEVDDKLNELPADTNQAEQPPKQDHLQLPSAISIYGSMASFDIQLNSPAYHISKPPANTSVLYRRSISDSGANQVLRKTRSVDKMIIVEENMEELEYYSLKKRRTSISMQHIPSSSLLKEMGENEISSSVSEKSEEEIKVQNVKDTDTSPTNEDSEIKKCPQNSDCYFTSSEAADLKSDSEVMLEEDTCNNTTVKDTPEINIIIVDKNEDTAQTNRNKKKSIKEFKDGRNIIRNNKSNSGCMEKLKNIRFIRLMGIRDVQYSVWLYTIYSFAVIGLEEVFTVWASTEIHLGGLAFTTDKIGAAIGMPSIPLLLLQVFIYPKIASRIGNIRTFQLFVTYLIFATPLIPALRAFHDNSTVLWTLLIIMQSIQKISFTSCFTSSSILINNSIKPELAGTVNGIAMTLTAISRTLGPLTGGSILSWSVSTGRHIGYPFDVNLVFIMFGVVYLSSNILSVFIPRSLEKQKKY